MIYKKLLRWFILVCLSFLMLQGANGIGETLSPWSQTFVNILSAFTYDSESREKHTVVLFREADLVDKVTGEINHFPVPYKKHIEILDQIARHSPKAILVDFSFIDSRNGDDVYALINQLCAIHQNKTKVYLSTFNYSLPNYGLREELAKTSLNTDSKHGCFKIVPVEYSPEINGVTHSFELFQNFQNKFVKSAPLEIYTDSALSKGTSFSARSPKMDIVWGWAAPDVTKTDKQCEKFRLITKLSNLLSKGPLSIIQDCPYSYTLNVHNILYESSETKRSRLHNKIVLYGGQFDGSSDYVTTPANGTIPGVYLLDMVLDNLITYGDSYKSIDPLRALNLRSITFWIDLLIITIGVGFYLYNTLIQKYLNQFLAPISKIFTNIIINFWQFTKYTFNRIKGNKHIYICKSIIDGHRQDHECQHSTYNCNYLWILVVTLSCLFFYFLFDLGARNFLAFLFFIGITTKIDKWIINRASKFHNKQFINKFIDSFTLITSLILTCIFVRWLYENEFNTGWFFTSLIVFIVSGFLIAIIFSFLCWIYEDYLCKECSRRTYEGI